MASPLKGMFGYIAAAALAGVAVLAPGVAQADQKPALPPQNTTTSAMNTAANPATATPYVKNSMTKAQSESRDKRIVGISVGLGKEGATYKQYGDENSQKALEAFVEQTIGTDVPYVVHYDLVEGKGTIIDIFIVGQPYKDDVTHNGEGLNIRSFATQGSQIVRKYNDWLSANSAPKKEF